MRKIVILLLLFLICGCQIKSDLYQELDNVFLSSNEKQSYRRNNYSSYIDYYVPSDLYEIDVDELSASYEYHNSKLIVNVNVSGIICAKYYPDKLLADEGFFDGSKMVYENKGTYLDFENSSNDYDYRLYEYDEYYLPYFLCKDLIIYGYCDKNDLVGLTSRILIMAKGADVKDDDVVAKYSSKDVIDYEKKQVNLFENIMPVNGNINDFLLEPKDSSVE